MQDTPPVFSVGKHCIENGFTFVFKPDNTAYFIDKGGKIVPLTVEGGIPYLKVGSQRSVPFAPRSDDWYRVGPEMSGRAAPAAHEGDVADGAIIEAPPGPFPPMAAPEMDPAVLQVPDADVDPESALALDMEEGLGGAPPVTVREQARQIEHLLTHLPANPYCDACQRGKMTQPRHMTGAFKRKLKKWCQIVTADHLVSSKTGWTIGVTGDVDALTVRDLWSRMIGCYPMRDESTESTVAALKDFVGGRKVELFYCDNSDELRKAGEELRFTTEFSQPGVPQTNGIAERNNRDILSGTRTALISAGLPACFWPYASQCYTMNRNCLVDASTGTSPWSVTHGGETLDGKLFPFGRGVWFTPSPSKYTPGKWDGRAQWGIFAGYRLSPGCQSRGDYLVWDLDQLISIDFSSDADGKGYAL